MVVELPLADEMTLMIRVSATLWDSGQMFTNPGHFFTEGVIYVSASANQRLDPYCCRLLGNPVAFAGVQLLAESRELRPGGKNRT